MYDKRDLQQRAKSVSQRSKLAFCKIASINSFFRLALSSFFAVFFTMILAFSLMSCASKRNKEDAVLHLRLGTSLLSQGNYPLALRELLEAERLDPKNAYIQNNLGLTYFLRERYDLSSQHLERALELDPKFSEARNNYGRVLIEMGRLDQAIAELERVTSDLTYPDPAKAMVNLGLARFQKGEFQNAREKFASAIKINRDHCLGQTYYGRSLLELGQFDSAALALDNAVAICRASKYDEPHYFSGLTYYKLGRTSNAVARMEEVVKLYPESRYAKKAESLLKLMK